MVLMTSSSITLFVSAGSEEDPELQDNERDTALLMYDILQAWFYEIPEEPNYLFTVLKINDLCRNRVLTNFTYYLTSLALLLNNYTSRQDIVIGSPFQGRDRFHDLKGMIGFFINTIPFRIIIDPDKSFLQLLKQVQKQLMYSFRNQEYPIENLVKKLKIDRSLNRNPLFDVFINYLPGE